MEITANRPGYEVSFVPHGLGGPDPNWISIFAKEGGTAIVSGDPNILQHWPNLIAYAESGLISFFPPKAYHRLSAYGRAAFLLRWWPAIVEKIKLSQRGDRWRLPINWTQIDHTKMELLKDPRTMNQRKNRIKRRARPRKLLSHSRSQTRKPDDLFLDPLSRPIYRR
jgi:hypothetical protein